MQLRAKRSPNNSPADPAEPERHHDDVRSAPWVPREGADPTVAAITTPFSLSLQKRLRSRPQHGELHYRTNQTVRCRASIRSHRKNDWLVDQAIKTKSKSRAKVAQMGLGFGRDDDFCAGTREL